MPIWETIKTTIETELADILGQYEIKTASGTVTKPAIWVFPPQPNSDRKVSGLEIIIQKTPEASRKELNRETQRTKTLTVRLIQHDQANGLEDAIDWCSDVLSKLTQVIETSSQLIPQTDLADEQGIIKATFIERVK